MNQITITYNYKTDETRMKTDIEENLPRIHKLDFLKDSLYELEQLYNAERVKWRESFTYVKPSEIVK